MKIMKNDVTIQMTPEQYEDAEKLLEKLALYLDTDVHVTDIVDGKHIMTIGGRL